MVFKAIMEAINEFKAYNKSKKLNLKHIIKHGSL
jgi:hypothetical protein